jgi:hypothetical protein
LKDGKAEIWLNHSRVGDQIKKNNSSPWSLLPPRRRAEKAFDGLKWR